jgi:CCR4-NOT transcriptional complex subunit CAF120
MLGNNDVSTQLSAREQEHVARMTRSPFFNLTSDNKQPTPRFGTSLVGAIDAREREKQAMKEGVSGQTVQQAIAQRQYQAQFQPPPQGQMYSVPSQQLYMNPQRTGGVGDNGAWGSWPSQQQQYWPSGPQARQQQIPSQAGYRPSQYVQPYLTSNGGAPGFQYQQIS